MLIAKEIILYIILSVFCFEIFSKYFSKFIIDRPVLRSSHFEDTPTSGGIIFLLIYLIYVFFNKKYSLLLLAPISILGFFDDVFNIKQIYRLFFQSINVLCISFLLLEFDFFLNLNLSNGFISIIVFLIGLTFVNLVNFMDGIDGLVASNMLLLFLNYSLNNNLDLISIPVVLFIFLFYNWSPAKIFMGDSGSTFLGIILFYMSLSNKDLNSSIVFILTASPLLMDGLVCILRRILNKENIFSPHKKHLYQRLNQNGMKHEKVSLIYAGCTFILIIFSQTNNLVIMSSLTLLVFLVGIYLEKNCAIPFKI